MPGGDETVRLVVDMGQSASNVEAVNTSLTKLDKELQTVAVSTEKVKSGAAGAGQSLLQTGRVVQDFTQGGLGGILNNIEGLAVALGGGPGLAGALTVLGVAALVVGPAVKSAWKSIIDGSNDIPKSTDNVEGFNAALKKNEERLEALTKQQKLTNTELVEFNRLTREQEQLEAKLRGARAAEAAKKVLSPEQRKAVEAMKRAEDAFGGQAVLDELERALILSGVAGARGGDAKRRAGELMARIQGGDVAGQAFAADILGRHGRGDVTRVLLGGQTPEELAKARADANKKEWDKAEQERQKHERERLAANDQVQARIARDNEAQRQKMLDDVKNRARGEGAQDEGIEWARRGANAFKPTRDAARDISLKGLDLGHLPLVQPGMSMEQAANVMEQGRQKAAMSEAGLMQRLIDNQSKLTGQQSNVLQRLRQQADRIAQELTEVGRSGGSNGFP